MKDKVLPIIPNLRNKRIKVVKGCFKLKFSFETGGIVLRVNRSVFEKIGSLRTKNR